MDIWPPQKEILLLLACQGGNKWNDGQWAYVRLLHMDVYNLIDEVNKIFGALVIQSYATNLTFILLQVYNGLKYVIIYLSTFHLSFFFAKIVFFHINRRVNKSKSFLL